MENSQLDLDNYSVDLDQDFFDAYLVQEWIESFDVPYGGTVDSANAVAEGDAIPNPDVEFTSLDVASSLEDFFTTYDLVAEVDPQPESIPGVETDTQSTQQLLHTVAARPQKRKLEECLSEFVGTRPTNATKKGRRPFSTEGKKKVDQVRKAGACIRCKLLKTQVSQSATLTNKYGTLIYRRV